MYFYDCQLLNEDWEEKLSLFQPKLGRSDSHKVKVLGMDEEVQ